MPQSCCCCRSVTRPRFEPSPFWRPAQCPRFVLPASAIICRMCAIHALPWPSIGRCACPKPGHNRPEAFYGGLRAYLPCGALGVIPASIRDCPWSGESRETGSGSSVYPVQRAFGSIRNAQSALRHRAGHAFETLRLPGAAGLMERGEGIIDRRHPSSRHRCAKTMLLSFLYNVFNL